MVKINSNIIQIANIKFGEEGSNKVNLERKIIILLISDCYLLIIQGMVCIIDQVYC